MPGLVDSLFAVSVPGLLADVGAYGSGAGLGFSLTKLAFLLAWVYGCLFTVRWVGDQVSRPFSRVLLQVVSLVAGPIVAAIFLFRQYNTTEEDNFILARLRRVRDTLLSRVGMKSATDDDDTRMRFFNSAGIELSEVYRSEGRGGEQQILEMTIQMIDDSVRQRASDILIDPKDETAYAVRLRIDGVLRTIREMPTATAKAVVNIVKVAASMDIAERRRPQDGSFTAKKGDISISFRVATAGALNGEKVSIRVLDQDIGRFSLVKLGIPERLRNLIGRAINKPSGMVLICGPTGSGKTTTLYSMLNQIDRLTHNVISVEDPIEARLPEVSQLEINSKAGITFAETLRSILRQDPDVICVGEIRDEETAEIAVRAAQTGHLVLATIHCESNATAIVRLLDLGVSPLLLASGLSVLISQRLVRRLCPHCRKPARLNPKSLEDFQRKGIDSSKISQPGGCQACSGTGYYGRTAICDVLVVDETLRSEIANNTSIANELRSKGDRKSQNNLRAEGMRLVIAGVTSPEELTRVTG